MQLVFALCVNNRVVGFCAVQPGVWHQSVMLPAKHWLSLFSNGKIRFQRVERGLTGRIPVRWDRLCQVRGRSVRCLCPQGSSLSSDAGAIEALPPGFYRSTGAAFCIWCRWSGSLRWGQIGSRPALGDSGGLPADRITGSNYCFGSERFPATGAI